METIAFRQPRIVALVALVILAAGLASFLALGRQEDPTITNYNALIVTQFPGANPERVEALVTTELEEEMHAIAEVAEVTSTSRVGVSIVSVELDETLSEADIEKAWSSLRDAVDTARTRFPAGVLVPDVNTKGGATYSAVIAVTATVEGISPILLSRHAETLADRLRAVPSTNMIDFFGQPSETVTINVDHTLATSLGLTVREIASRIEAGDGKVQSGELNGDVSLSLNVTGEITSLDRIRQIVLRENEQGTIVTVGDIAVVDRGTDFPRDNLAFANGVPAILIGLVAEDGVQIDRWMQHVNEIMAEGAGDVPFGMHEVVLFDQSIYTIDRLTDVFINMAIGMGLVILVLLVTLGLRAAAIVAFVLPLVALATLATMNLIGLPLHQMSVTGLIVALGLLVDAAIVMTDEVRHRLALGMEREDAVRGAVRRLFAPLLASTLTTVLAFMPMVLLPGGAGDFIGAVAIAVIVMLLWSFILAIIVTPAIAGWVLPTADRTSGLAFPTLGRWFEASVLLAVKNPVRAIALALILPATGFASFSTLTAQFFPGVERNQFYIEVDMPPGTAIIDTAEIVQAIDTILRDDSGVASTYWTVGQSAPAFYYNIVGDRSQEPGYAQGMITTKTDMDAARLVSELQSKLDETFTSAQIVVRGLVQGPPVSAPVEIKVRGQDPQVLRQIGHDLRALMSDLDIVTQVRVAMNDSAPLVRFEIDEIKARLLGLDITEVARQLDAALVGVTGGSLVDGTLQIPVRVQLDAELRSNLNAIADMPILLPHSGAISESGALPSVPLSELAHPIIEPSASVVHRAQGLRENAVQAFIPPGVLPEEALQIVLAEIEKRGFEAPDGYDLLLGGDSEERSDTVGNLLASLGLIITLAIATIVLSLNSFRLTLVTLIVCCLSVGLSVLALALMGYPLGILAIIGVIGSVGVSINAAIIILTNLQEDKAAAGGNTQAMARVVAGSARHIVSTTITTFGGFLPLILQGGGFWPPFAVAIAGGVLLSTVVSFYFTPPMFALVHRRILPAKPLEAVVEGTETSPKRLLYVAE